MPYTRDDMDRATIAAALNKLTAEVAAIKMRLDKPKPATPAPAETPTE